MDERNLGLLLVAVGLGAVVLGLAVYTGAFGWFGRLPGDIRIEGDNFRLYIPLASMLLLSLAVSLLIAVIQRVL